MPDWIFIPTGLRLDARLRFATDGTIRRSVVLSGMEQDADQPAVIGAIDRSGDLIVSRDVRGRRLRIRTERIAEMSAPLPRFEEEAARMAAIVAAGRASSAHAARPLDIIWQVQTISRIGKPDEIDWFQLLVADNVRSDLPPALVFLRLINSPLTSGSFTMVQSSKGEYRHPRHFEAITTDAGREPSYVQVRTALEERYRGLAEELLPSGAVRVPVFDF